MIFTLKQLEEKSQHKPQGYKQEILEKSRKIDDDKYELSDENFSEVAKKYRLPSKIEMIKNIAIAAKELAQQGLDVRNQNEIEECLTSCVLCPFWVEADNRCGKCGCMLEYKVKLKSWHCPLKKW